VTGLIIVCAVILSFKYKAFWISHGLVGKGLESAGASSKAFSSESKTIADGEPSDGSSKVVPVRFQLSDVNGSKKDEFFAPIIIGAGQGTTGTHLFAEVTCRLGFVSLHWAIGCVPSNVISLKYPTQQLSNSAGSDVTAHHPQNSQRTPCPVSISKFNNGYSILLRYHTSAMRGYSGSKRSDNNTRLFRDKILENLDGVITWGKKNKVALAIHDTPYPKLMPEIIKLVQKHYGNLAKPIILLSERDPQEWAARRIKTHVSDIICQPTRSGRNSSTPIAIEPMNTTTFEGGAFDIIGCTDHAISAHEISVATDNAQSPAPQMSQIVYSMKQVNQLQQRQFIVDTMDDYQNAMRGHSVISYNMFDKENRTSASELAALVKQSMVEALVKADGSIRMEEGLDFLGFDIFFASEDRLDGERSATHDKIALLGNQTELVPVHLSKKILLTTLHGKMPRQCPK